MTPQGDTRNHNHCLLHAVPEARSGVNTKDVAFTQQRSLCWRDGGTQGKYIPTIVLTSEHAEALRCPNGLTKSQANGQHKGNCSTRWV